MRSIKFKVRCEYHKKNIEVTVQNFLDFSESAKSDYCQEMANKCSWSRMSQYTGFLDIDDTEIYEHDIIQLTFCNDEWPVGLFEVKFVDGHWFICQVSGDFSTCSSLQFLADVAEDDAIKVVGNVYENPELVEKNLNTCLS